MSVQQKVKDDIYLLATKIHAALNTTSMSIDFTFFLCLDYKTEKLKSSELWFRGTVRIHLEVFLLKPLYEKVFSGVNSRSLQIGQQFAW